LENEGLNVGHYDMRFAKPLDEELLLYVSDRYNHIITIEDGTKIGGFGSAVAEYLITHDRVVPMTILGVPDQLVEHGTQQELYAEVGIDSLSIAEIVRSIYVREQVI
jgi:1-deoxy-D-xylulose-5-phosphate synthase